MNWATGQSGGADALDCAGNGASRQVVMLEVCRKHESHVSEGFTVITKRRGAEWEAQAKHANLY